MNRKQIRADIALKRKLRTVWVEKGNPIQAAVGYHTGSNRSRPHVRFKVASGNVKNRATLLLRQIRDWCEDARIAQEKESKARKESQRLIMEAAEKVARL